MEKKKSAITQTLTQPDASDRLFTRAEVAEYLNIGTTFIEQLRRQGKLPSYRLSGKCIRYKKSDCDVLLDHCFIVRPAKVRRKEKSNENSHDKPNFSRRKRVDVFI